jgi:hypothetical protein
MSSTSTTTADLQVKQGNLIHQYNKINTQIKYLTTHIYELQTYFQYLESNQNKNILFKFKLDRLKSEIETLGTFKLLLLASASKKADEINEIQFEIYGEDVVMAAYQQQEQQQQQQDQQQEHHQSQQTQDVQLMM